MNNNSHFDLVSSTTDTTPKVKFSPLPKPDFSSIEKKESSFTYKQKGSYKKPKSLVPESPMKSPNQRFFTPVKLNLDNNLLGISNKSTCRKLTFAVDEDVEMDDNKNYLESFKQKNAFLDKLDEDEERSSGKISPINPMLMNKTKSGSSFYDRVFEENERENIIVMKNSEFNVDADFKMKKFGSFNFTNFDKNDSEKKIKTEDEYYNLANTANTLTNDNNLINNKFEKDFFVINAIEAGAFGIVYKCVNKTDNKIYAVKKSKKHSSFKDYTQIQSIISDFQKNTEDSFSGFIVNTTDCWIDNEIQTESHMDDHLFISQEYCANGDLLNFLEKLENASFNFTDKFYWDLIFEMMCGVYFVHKCDIVHFDIKPSNFLISQEGLVKLGDFGLSKKLSEIDDFNEGDSIYLAPEFFGSKKAKISNKCDTFSLGLSILEILCKVELPQNGHLWNQIRSANFIIPDEFTHNSNIKINHKMIELILLFISVDCEARPEIQTIFENEYFEEINKRYKQLLNNEYFSNKAHDIPVFKVEDSFFAKRSNSCYMNDYI